MTVLVKLIAFIEAAMVPAILIGAVWMHEQGEYSAEAMWLALIFALLLWKFVVREPVA